MCCKWGGCKGKLPSRLLLMELVSLLHEGCRSDSTKSSSYRSTEWVCSKWWRGLARESSITPHGTSFRCRSRSAGQVRRSLLSVGPLLYTCSKRSLAWLCVLSLYVVATRWIPSVMLGMWRSLWSSRLLTYQGPFSMVLRSFDWNRWIVFNLAGLAHPHNWTPYDQMGLRTTLYRSNLLFRNNLELRLRSQSICLNLISSCLRFARMCVCQVSRCSKWRPRYLTSAATGMGAFLIVKDGQTFVRVVNVTCTDLACFTWILHRVCHSARELRWVCRCRVADTGYSLANNTATSSANDAIVVWPVWGMSAVKIKNSKGPRTLSCGTPASIG